MEKFEDIYYVSDSKNKKHQLDVFTPSSDGFFPVIIFIHGGSWYTGCKEWYHQLGVNMAEKGIVTVVINYRLGDEANFEDMAEDGSSAIKWIKEYIQDYKGQSDAIFVGGHSAGGHLSALITLNKMFFSRMGMTDPVRGCILIDAFGLNMDYFMFNNNSFFIKELLKVFTKDPQKWKEAAPVNFIKGNKVPFLIFIGSRTYPYLTLDNELFKMNLAENNVSFIYKIIKNKNHVDMITSMQNSSDPMYDDILTFVKENSLIHKGIV